MHAVVGSMFAEGCDVLSVHVLVREAIQGKIQLHRHRSLVNAQRIKLGNVVPIDLQAASCLTTGTEVCTL